MVIKKLERWAARNGNRNVSIFKQWYENGNNKLEKWIVNNKYHRTCNPAYTEWFENGNKKYERWYSNGKNHRSDGPALTNWYKNGQKKIEYWYLNGNLQNISRMSKKIYGTIFEFFKFF